MREFMPRLLDITEIKTLLTSEKASAWRDDAGNTLLHHAARLGDAKLVQECLDRGQRTLAVNEEGDRPSEIARAWGWDEAAVLIETHQRQEKLFVPSLKCASMAELREAPGGIYMAVKKYSLQPIVALALKTGETFAAEDFLTPGADGNTPLMVICARGEFPLLLNVELWKTSQAFKTMWKHVPQAYQKDLDISSFNIHLTQTKLKLSTRAPKLRGPQ
jgi:ankyrin repeat protein